MLNMMATTIARMDLQNITRVDTPRANTDALINAVLHYASQESLNNIN